MHHTSILPAKSFVSRDELPSLWSRLGITFASEPVDRPVDLERMLLCSLEHAVGQRKTLKLVAAWLGSFGDLVHVERLVCLIRNGKWIDDSSECRQARTLAALADRLLEGGDRRWKTVITELQKTLGTLPPGLPADEEASFLIARDGADPHFAKFGIQMPMLDAVGRLAGSTHKKLRAREFVLATNPWLRLRAALGSNWRADVLFVILSGLAANPFQASRLLGCSYETAHRIWSGAVEAKVKELFQVDAWGNSGVG